MKKNIILIGMPGVGKSTVGVVLAKVMGYQFIDADLVIQEKEGKLLREIIAEVGPEGFLKVENRINSCLLYTSNPAADSTCQRAGPRADARVVPGKVLNRGRPERL